MLSIWAIKSKAVQFSHISKWLEVFFIMKHVTSIINIDILYYNNDVIVIIDLYLE